MSNSNPKKPTGKEPTEPKAITVKPILFKDAVEDEPEEKIDLAKAYDWTKKYSYDPEGRTYIRSMPTDDLIDPKDDPALKNS